MPDGSSFPGLARIADIVLSIVPPQLADIRGLPFESPERGCKEELDARSRTSTSVGLSRFLSRPLRATEEI